MTKLLFIDPVVGMLHNQQTNRWHPILFVGAPFPGGVDTPMRHHSKGHHTAGFDTRDEANAGAKLLGDNVYGARMHIDNDIEWDGVEIPAMTMFFEPRSADTP